MANGIKRLRTSRGFTTQQLADELGIKKMELSQFERGWQQLPPMLVRDLAIIFECTVADILGDPVPVEEWQRSKYAAGSEREEDLEAYGDFAFRISEKSFTFPISSKTHLKLRSWFDEHDPGSAEEKSEWLTCGTLNNRILFLNPAKLSRASLISDDDEAISYFAHPEVYRAVDERSSDHETSWGSILTQAFDEHVLRLGREAAEAEVNRLYVYGANGHLTDDEWYLSDAQVLTSLMALDMNSFSIVPDSWLLVDSAGYYRSDYVNLSAVALIDAPLERYLRLGAPDERAANEIDEPDEDQVASE